jgi:hypothetical protein
MQTEKKVSEIIKRHKSLRVYLQMQLRIKIRLNQQKKILLSLSKNLRKNFKLSNLKHQSTKREKKS